MKPRYGLIKSAPGLHNMVMLSRAIGIQWHAQTELWVFDGRETLRVVRPRESPTVCKHMQFGIRQRHLKLLQEFKQMFTQERWLAPGDRQIFRPWFHEANEFAIPLRETQNIILI